MRRSVLERERERERKRKKEREREDGGMFILYSADAFLKRGLGEGCSCDKKHTHVRSFVITPRVFTLHTHSYTLLSLSLSCVPSTKEQRICTPLFNYVYTIVVARSTLQ